jgi:ubiquitin carboxyl-terminal hydrolase 22/27/51
VNKCKYKLYGLVYHKGTLDFGHYYAHININDKWIEFNDQKITVLDELSTKSKYVYLLFYQQIESKKNKLNDRVYKGSYL